MRSPWTAATSFAALALLLLLAGGAPLGADELRFSYIFGEEDFDFNTPGGGTLGIEWDESRRLEAAAFGSGQTSIGLAVQKHDAEASGSSAGQDWHLDYEAWLFRIYTGYTLALSQSFRMEVAGFTGLGVADAELKHGSDKADDSDFIFDYGAQAYIAMQVNQGISVGGGVGYLFSETSFDLLGEKRAVDQEGMFYFATLGWRF